MSSPVRRFDICAGRPYTTRDGEDKKQWINVGRMTEWDDGNFSIELHAVPTGQWFDGRLSVFEPKPKDGEQTGNGGRSGSRGGAPQRERPQRATEAAEDFDSDSIPFVSQRGPF